MNGLRLLSQRASKVREYPAACVGVLVCSLVPYTAAVYRFGPCRVQVKPSDSSAFFDPHEMPVAAERELTAQKSLTALVSRGPFLDGARHEVRGDCTKMFMKSVVQDRRRSHLTHRIIRDTAIYFHDHTRSWHQGAFRNLAGGERSLSTLKNILAEKIPGKQADLLKLKKEHGHKSVGEVSISLAAKWPELVRYNSSTPTAVCTASRLYFRALLTGVLSSSGSNNPARFYPLPLHCAIRRELDACIDPFAPYPRGCPPSP